MEPIRGWWCNCSLKADKEILAIDALEDRIAPLSETATHTRELISSFELCHHKAERWMENIINAIGTGQSDKGLGTRAPNRLHPTETVWLNTVAALNLWCAGCPVEKVGLSIGNVSSSQLLAGLGVRTPLKEWQVQRVVDKIRSQIHFPRSSTDPSAQYVWLLLGGGEYAAAYRDVCPEFYVEHEEFWRMTVRTIIHDTADGVETGLSLAVAIDMLWPCHWDFIRNLRLVLGAIGGNLHPATPFAACGRNITRYPNVVWIDMVKNTLRTFHTGIADGETIDDDMLAKLGSQTEEKRWLAASLEKTLRLQLDPPENMRIASALEGPRWIYE